MNEHLFDGSSRRSNDVVDGVDRYPHHRGETHHDPHDLCPRRVLIVRAVLDGHVLAHVEHEDKLRNKSITLINWQH